VDFLKSVNSTTVTAEMLAEVLEMHAAMPAGDRGVYEARMFKMFDLLDQKGLRKERRQLAMAVDFRLTALARLQSDNALRGGWSLPGSEAGMDYIHHDLLKAAAEEPVIENTRREAAFDLESFQRRVLALTEARGQA
jgi:hypothetical protein